MRSLLEMCVVVALLGSGVSCGGSSLSCEDLCAKIRACDGGTGDWSAICATQCANSSTLNSAAGCTSAFSDELSCAGDHQDQICVRNTTVCASQVSAYTACTSNYCAAHAGAPGCP